MTENFFQNFENSPSLEFFCEFFWQTLNFYCQSSYGQIFFKLCIHTLKNTYFRMNQEKKYTFSPKAKYWPWKRPFFCITILLSKKLHESKIWPHFYFSNFLSLWSESGLIFSKFWVFQHEIERASRRTQFPLVIEAACGARHSFFASSTLALDFVLKTSKFRKNKTTFTSQAQKVGRVKVGSDFRFVQLFT